MRKLSGEEWKPDKNSFSDGENFLFFKTSVINFSSLYFIINIFLYRPQYFFFLYKRIIFEQTLKRKEPKMLILKNIN